MFIGTMFSGSDSDDIPFSLQPWIKCDPSLPETLLSSVQLDSISRLETPPSTTPTRPYPFSEQVQKDRPLFLKGASLGICCRNDKVATAVIQSSFIDWNGLIPYGGTGRRSGSTENQGQNVFHKADKRTQLGMTLEKGRLLSVNCLQLDLANPSRAWESRDERCPLLHQRPKVGVRRRPLNERLNTYVDTMKRIRSVQCAEDLYRDIPTPSFPFLIAPIPSPRLPQQPPAFGSSASWSPKSLLLPTPNSPSCLTKHPFVRVHKSHQASGTAATYRSFQHPADCRQQDDTVSIRHLGRIGQRSVNSDNQLQTARQMLHNSQKTPCGRGRDDRILVKEGYRFFKSYPKRILTVYPAGLLRQRSQLLSRSRVTKKCFGRPR